MGGRAAGLARGRGVSPRCGGCEELRVGIGNISDLSTLSRGGGGADQDAQGVLMQRIRNHR